MADSSAKKENWSLQSHDGPCSNCRVRKIKCGREKPECSICRQAQVECVYTPPPKRVNHVKVLCESFDEVNERLNMVQAQLSALTSMLGASGATGLPGFPANNAYVAAAARPEHSRSASCPTLLDHDAGDRIVPGGFVIREEGTLNERYYGPWTLDYECRSFTRDVSPPLNVSAAPNLLQKFQRALENTPVDLPSPQARQGQNSERLLPKAFLSVMVERLVDQADFCTDIFLKESLYDAVDRVYSGPKDSLHEAWAVCLDLIFLFVLGAKQPLRAADHTQPLFDAVDSAIGKHQLFMAPRLIAVQTLALLSLIAPSYYPESISDVVFAQACHMATMMGLHCHDHITPGQTDLDLSFNEIAERRKLWRSLYIRERFYATARGTLRRLPRYLPDTPRSRSSSRAMSQEAPGATLASVRGESPSVSTAFDEANEPLFNMAMIQDELHAAMFPGGNPPETRMLEQKMVVANIRQKLTAFAKAHRLPSLRRPETFQDLGMHLAYLGTRIRAHEVDLADDDDHHVLDDARLSCLLFMSACSDEKGMDKTAADKLDGLLRRMALRDWRRDGTPVSLRSPAESTKSAGAGGQSSEEEGDAANNSPRAPNKRFCPFGADSLASPTTQVLRGQRVLELMPTSAIFILARNILRALQGNAASPQQSSAPSGSDPRANRSPRHGDELAGKASEDFAILCGFTHSLESSLGVSKETKNSYGSKFLRVAQTLVTFIREAGNLPVQQPSSPPAEMRRDVLELATQARLAPDGGLGSSASSSSPSYPAGNAAEPPFMSLGGTTWESTQGPNPLSFPFSPSFDLSSMNISSTVADSLFDFDFSQHFDNVPGGFMSPAEHHLLDPESLRGAAGQDKRKKRLRLDCSQELDGPGDRIMSTWPPQNRGAMAKGSV